MGAIPDGLRPTEDPDSFALPPIDWRGVVNNREAASSGDRRKALEVLRDTLAEQLDLTEAQIHAQLAAQYRATLAELAEFAEPAAKSASERFAERVAAANASA